MDAALQDAFMEGLELGWRAGGYRGTYREKEGCAPLELQFLFGDDDYEADISVSFVLEDGKYYVYWLYIWSNHGVVEFWRTSFCLRQNSVRPSIAQVPTASSD